MSYRIAMLMTAIEQMMNYSNDYYFTMMTNSRGPHFMAAVVSVCTIQVYIHFHKCCRDNLSREKKKYWRDRETKVI